MLSISQKKIVNSLKQKKFRTELNAFVVEGVKMVDELLQSDYEIEAIYATSNWIDNHADVECTEISEKELKIISSLKTPNEVLAVVKQKEPQLTELSSQLNIALDKIQDPGNFGTIIRTADWFGVQNIICTEDTVDVYNPKVIQATMGSFFRMNIVYTDLSQFFSKNKELTVYGVGTAREWNSILLPSAESQGLRILVTNFGVFRVWLSCSSDTKGHQRP